MNPVSHETATLNHLLQSEASAVETYTQVLNQFDDLEVISTLQTMRDEHSRAVRALRDQIVRSGAMPADHPGDGNRSNATNLESAEMIGPATVLALLCQSEEQEICECETVLNEADLQLESQRLIRSQLLPGCRTHVEKLNALLGGLGH